MNRWSVVARREFRGRALSPVNWIITLVLMAIVALGAAVGPKLVSDLAADGSSWRLADDPATEQVAGDLGIAAPAEAEDEAGSTVALDYVDGALVVEVTGTVPVEVIAALEHRQALADAQRIAAESGVDYHPTSVVVEVAAGTGGEMTTFVAIVAILGLIFAFVMLSATSLATGLVEEKSTNVVEILAPYVPARDLLFGKIVAIGLFTLLQGAVLAATAFAASAWGGTDAAIDSSVIASGVLWLAIAYFSFAALFAVAASLVSSQEDAGALLNPLGVAMFVPLYVATFVAIPTPGSALTTVLSYVPLLSPFVMPVRQAYVDVPGYEVLVSAGIGIGFAAVLVWLAARAYERTILLRGRRLTLREAFGGIATDSR